MRKRIVCSAAGIVTGLMLTFAVPGHKVQAEEYEYEQMELLQEGATGIPSEDYSFEEDETEYLYTYLADTTKDETEKRQEAIEARANNNATLAERKKQCAAALYTGMTNFERRISVAQYALSRDEFKEVISNVVNSNPELFYIRNGYKVKTFVLPEEDSVEIVDYCQGFYEYQDNNDNPLKDKITGLVSELQQKRSDILSSILTTGMSEVEKALQVHEYLALTVAYDKVASDLYDQDHNLSHFPDSDYDVYGTLIKGQAVCQGYALSYKYLMEAAGVEDIGFASNENHVWNTITLQDGSYYVDCTWDDPAWDTLGDVRHRYFLKNDSNFTGHGTITTDRSCDGTGLADMFWDNVESGIFYYKGTYYYLADKKLYKTKIHTAADLAAKPEVVATFDLKEAENWEAGTDAKIALGEPYILYHDVENIYFYDLKTGKNAKLASPKLEESEHIYGLTYQGGTIQYATRTQRGTKQKINTYDLPTELFYITAESVTVSGAHTIEMKMENHKLVSQDVDLKATVLPENATDRRIRRWLSSDTSIAVVDINGRVKAVAPGKVTITAESYDGISGTYDVQVILVGAVTDASGATVYYENGEKLTDQFYQVDGGICYLGTDGRKVTGWQTIDGNQYYFDANGHYVTGWQTIDGKQYYFNDRGIMIAVGWQTVNGKQRYLSESGAMLTGWQRINGAQYYFMQNGDMVTGWQSIGGNWYFFNTSGVMQTDTWQMVEGKLRYVNENGVMVTGWQTIAGKRYYFAQSGNMVTGWQTISSNRYYFDSNGVMQTGWKTIKKKTYYFNKKGVMQTGWQTIRKKTYYFNKKGVMQTGWKTIRKKTYYFNKKGVMQTGWKTIKKKTYYFNKKGVMQTGWKTIGKKTYYFNKKGVMLKGLQVINGISYYFDMDGHFIS
ncbi:MAG: Ig-like domain-containing protein [Lachnospiraceae bacterium]|nr:Ig-like domain-containing protein [Lachnospiraceae bacterium]